VAHAHEFLLRLLVARAGNLCDQLLFARRERPNILEPAVDHGCVAIGRDQRVQRSDKAPDRRVHHRFVAGVNVSLRAAAPLLAACDQFQLDNALGSQIDRNGAVDVLPACGNEDALGLLERGEDIGALHDLVKVRRADFFLALGNQHDVDREFHLCRTHRMKRGEHSRLGSFLIDGAAADDGVTESGFVDDPPFERR
jgi:hypothetical protein